MIKIRILLTVACCFLWIPFAMASNVDVSPLKTKFLRDVAGRIAMFSYKTEITNNNSVDEDICVTFQAIDKDGFEIKHVLTCSSIPANSTKPVTDTETMPLDEWNRIESWQVKD